MLLDLAMHTGDSKCCKAHKLYVLEQYIANFYQISQGHQMVYLCRIPIILLSASSHELVPFLDIVKIVKIVGSKDALKQIPLFDVHFLAATVPGN